VTTTSRARPKPGCLLLGVQFTIDYSRALGTLPDDAGKLRCRWLIDSALSCRCDARPVRRIAPFAWPLVARVTSPAECGMTSDYGWTGDAPKAGAHKRVVCSSA
jgi:hypothetical protein